MIDEHPEPSSVPPEIMYEIQVALSKKILEECSKHILCHCSCHGYRDKARARHCFPCCHKCVYCGRKVVK